MSFVTLSDLDVDWPPRRWAPLHEANELAAISRALDRHAKLQRKRRRRERPEAAEPAQTGRVDDDHAAAGMQHAPQPGPSSHVGADGAASAAKRQKPAPSATAVHLQPQELKEPGKAAAQGKASKPSRQSSGVHALAGASAAALLSQAAMEVDAMMQQQAPTLQAHDQEQAASRAQAAVARGLTCLDHLFCSRGGGGAHPGSSPVVAAPGGSTAFQGAQQRFEQQGLSAHVRAHLAAAAAAAQQATGSQLLRAGDAGAPGDAARIQRQHAEAFADAFGNELAELAGTGGAAAPKLLLLCVRSYAAAAARQQQRGLHAPLS